MKAECGGGLAMDRPKVAIIILNWNRKDDTLACLRSLDRVAYEEREILVVDNHSTDGSVDAFRENYPGIEIIENDKNLGYAAGNNVGIRRAMENAADVILLLNNDTEVEPGFLGAMVDVLESDAHIGAVGPKIYYFSEPGVLWATGDMEGLGQRDVGQFNSVSRGQVDRWLRVPDEDRRRKKDRPAGRGLVLVWRGRRILYQDGSGRFQDVLCAWLCGPA